MMPPRGGAGRAEAAATLERISHEHVRLRGDRARCSKPPRVTLNGADPDSDDGALVRSYVGGWDKARRVPTELAAEMARAASLGQEAWIEARARARTSIFAPYLERNCRAGAALRGLLRRFECAYDVAARRLRAADEEPRCRRLFDRAASAELVPLIATVAERHGVDDSSIHGDSQSSSQRQLVAEAGRADGLRPRPAGGMDDTVHPFATCVRHATTCGSRLAGTRATSPPRCTARCTNAVTGCTRRGSPHSLQRTPLAHGESLRLHESQSRLWENMVGRGRPFCGVLAPRIAVVLGAVPRRSTPTPVPRRQPGARRRSSASRPTRRRTACTSCLRFELEQELIEGTAGRRRSPRGVERSLQGVPRARRSRRRARRAPGRPLVVRG